MGVETQTVSSTGARKGEKKQRFNLLPPRAVMELAKLYGAGAQKYAPNNFRLGYESSKSFAAGQRHGVLFWAGENYDTEMGCHHLASVVWHAFTMLECNFTHPEFDDRPYLNRPKASAPPAPEALSIAPTPSNIPTLYRHDLIPMRPFSLVAEVFGTRPDLSVFADDITYGTLFAQMQQHMNLYWSGVDLDEESDLPNLAWAAAYGLLLLELSLDGGRHDDRFIPAAALPFDSVPVSAIRVAIGEVPDSIVEDLKPALARMFEDAEPSLAMASI